MLCDWVHLHPVDQRLPPLKSDKYHTRYKTMHNVAHSPMTQPIITTVANWGGVVVVISRIRTYVIYGSGEWGGSGLKCTRSVLGSLLSISRDRRRTCLFSFSASIGQQGRRCLHNDHPPTVLQLQLRLQCYNTYDCFRETCNAQAMILLTLYCGPRLKAAKDTLKMCFLNMLESQGLVVRVVSAGVVGASLTST